MTGETVNHEYSTNGNYTIILTVTDDDGNTNTDTTYATVITATKIKTTAATINEIETAYNVTIDDLFYAYDTDGDDTVDTFVDPNGVLKTVPISYINQSGDILFAVSVNDSYIPEFFWNTSSDEIIEITSHEITIDEDDIAIDTNTEEAWITITVNKSDWICIGFNNEFTDSSYTITAGDRTIPANMTWKSEDKIFFIDDPDTVYTIYYQDIYSDVEPPTLSPSAGGIINENRSTISIVYNVDVTISYASFGPLIVTSDILKLDDQTYSYTPPGYLEYDFYTFEIHATANQGNSEDVSTAVYEFVPYSNPPEPPEESFISKYMWIIILIGTLGGCAGVVILLRKKGVTFESFIYFKNKKIIPFLKPVVFGPLSIDVNDKKISKAEFYVNGQLKDTITQAPYVWKWDEPAFLRHKIETKVYDEEGKSSSSGEMTFYVFNPPWRHK